MKECSLVKWLKLVLTRLLTGQLLKLLAQKQPFYRVKKGSQGENVFPRSLEIALYVNICCELKLVPINGLLNVLRSSLGICLHLQP